MFIILKNGEKLKLEITPILLEYVEEYDGGIEQLKMDIQIDNRKMLAINHMIYSVIASNYHEELSYRAALSLVQVRDMEKIADFLMNELKDSEIQENNIKTLKHRR